MSHYSKIAIIYNPNSTGSGKDLAADLLQRLKARQPKLAIELVQTKHTGHGEQLAYDIATKETHALIISSSGDGGYHDVINGAMRAQIKGAQVTTGLLPAGNANDHYHNVHDENIVDAILNEKEQVIDLLKLTSMAGSKPSTKYAHSYIGIGFTPQVGEELNKTKLNPFNEVLIVFKTLIGYKAVKIVVDSSPKTYTSLIFSNVKKMSKLFALSELARPDDGKFELTMNPHQSKLRLIMTFLKASTIGLPGTTHAESFQFTTIKPLLVQLDGETITLDGHSDVEVTLDRSAIHCIV